VHEWNGLGKYVKSRAEKLAQLGYVAFAADIYGKGVRPEKIEDWALSRISGKGLRKTFKQNIPTRL